MKYNGKDVGDIIAIDFDGTITTEIAYPELGKPNLKVINAIKNAQSQGVKFILWTNRQDDNVEVPQCLTAAVELCRFYGIEFDAINDNLPEVNEIFIVNARKITADYYVDDKSPGSIEWFLDKYGRR